MKRFFSREFDQDYAILRDGERDHCVRVLRTALGEGVEVVDGMGRLYAGNLTDSGKQMARIRLSGEPQTYARPVLPVVATAIPKNPARWEFFLEKAVELGVERIIPLVAARSDKGRIRRERHEQIILSAFKQSGRYYLPVLDDPRPLPEVVGEAHLYAEERFIAWCGDDDRLPLGRAHRPGCASLILIGPEGDFTPEEVSLAKSNGFVPVSLGDARLRVETAALAACLLLQ